jgi:hypothetical protein
MLGKAPSHFPRFLFLVSPHADDNLETGTKEGMARTGLEAGQKSSRHLRIMQVVGPVTPMLNKRREIDRHHAGKATALSAWSDGYLLGTTHRHLQWTSNDSL